MTRSAESFIKQITQKAAITINGSNPWDIQILDKSFYTKILSGGSLALGETYMQGLWTVDKLDVFFERLFSADTEDKIKPSWSLKWLALKSKIFNRQSRNRSFTVGHKHYDLDNELYKLMLDSNMVYSCGYWDKTDSLEQAQENKLDLICRKLRLKPGMKLLDIGCGWGSLVKYAAQKYSVSAVGITVSKEQAKVARQQCQNLPVEIRLQDYRELGCEQFNAIASVGMVEHVGYKNYKRYMQIVDRCLNPKGLFLLHTIGNNCSEQHTDPWIEKYIFPNSMLPSLSQLAMASEKVFSIKDLHSFGSHYDKTLMAWYQNFADNWHLIKDKYDQTFYRMWEYYLLISAAGFRTGRMQVWQLLMTKLGNNNCLSTIR